ncbi:MAG: DUF11 domain-containing protein, partial [Candidatus Hydrogenedentes bacterium]|nr:DUF11 domain-containing protein [Candidatus Hydrogenedentota bacterium]
MKKSVLITRYSSSWIRKVYGIFLVVIIVGVVPAAFADSPCLSLSRAVNDSVYKAGQEILVTLTLQNNCTHTITSLGITETLPEGWQFISGEVINGAAPVQWPESGSMDPLEIFWITVPELPLSLWYTVKTPDTAIDPAFFSGHAIFSFAAG